MEALERKNNEIEKKALRKEMIKEFVPLGGLIALVILFSILTHGRFLTIMNLSMILNQSFTLIITSLGAVFLYTFGAFHVGLGSICMLSAICSVMVAINTGSGILSFLVCIAVSVVSNIIIAFVACKMNVIPFVGSLCISFIAQGLASQLLSTGEISMPSSISNAVDKPLIKLIVAIVAIVVIYILFERTKVGNYCKAIGGNETVARQSGIPVDRYKFIAFIISGIMLGIAAFFLVCRIKQASTTTGDGLHMQVMLSIILGGMSLRGGPKSRMTAPIIGSLITYTLSSGFSLLSVSPYYIEFIQGIIFLAVIFTVFPKKRTGALPN